MKNIFILLFFLCLSSVYSQTNERTLNKPHKINHEQFIQQYGTDDTSKALIDLFFDKRQSGVVNLVSAPISQFVGSVLALAGIVSIFNDNEEVGVALIITGNVFGVLSYVGFVRGIVLLIRYDRKQLLELVNEYHDSGKIASPFHFKVLKRLNKPELKKLHP